MTDLVQPLNGGNFIHQEGPGSSCGSLLDRFSLKGKTAVVTGAGGGIGLSVAQAFAELGANVAIWYNSNESAHDRAREISEKYGVKCKCRIFRFKSSDRFQLTVKQARHSKSTSKTTPQSKRLWTTRSGNSMDVSMSSSQTPVSHGRKDPW